MLLSLKLRLEAHDLEFGVVEVLAESSQLGLELEDFVGVEVV